MASSGSTLITIADSSLEVRAKAKEALAHDESIHTCEATSFDAVRHQLANSPSGVLVFSLSLPGSRYFSGLAGVKAIRREHPALKMIAWVDGCSSASISSAISIGVDGISSVAAISTELNRAIAAVKAGREYVSPLLRGTRNGDAEARVLSPMEEQVMRLVHRGLSNWEIAQACGSSASTVSKHKQTALLKLVLDSPSVWRPGMASDALTPEEDQVMRLVRAGFTNAEIAKRCRRPAKAVAKQKESALLKLTVDKLGIWQPKAD